MNLGNLTPAINKDMAYIDPKDIFNISNSGLDIICNCYPQAKSIASKSDKKFRIRSNDKTPSARPNGKLIFFKRLELEELYFNHFHKKKKHVGFRVSEYEKDQIDQFCQKEQISISDFLRYAIRKVINEKSAK